MRIDLHGSIAGVPVFLLRSAFRERAGRAWSPKGLAADVGAADAADLMRQLEREGLVEPYPSEGPDRWTATVKGNALGNARGRRVSRATAQRNYDAFLERVEQLRRDSHYLWRVHRVSVFGSFADPNASDVGDVDLVVELATKEPNWEKHLKLEERYRNTERARGRRFSSFFDDLVCPRTDPLKFLKGGSAVLSIHDAGEYSALPLSAFTVVYEDPIDEPNRTAPEGARKREEQTEQIVKRLPRRPV